MCSSDLVEMGKILAESAGEVQEMIDICDFALGLSRQLHGLTIVSERPKHRLMEQWHPLGPVGVITAFNFPVAVWSWNAALAFVCGNPVIWKPSEKTPLTALATQALFERAAKRFGDAPPALSQLALDASDEGGGPRQTPPRDTHGGLGAHRCEDPAHKGVDLESVEILTHRRTSNE